MFVKRGVWLTLRGLAVHFRIKVLLNRWIFGNKSTFRCALWVESDEISCPLSLQGSNPLSICTGNGGQLWCIYIHLYEFSGPPYRHLTHQRSTSNSEVGQAGVISRCGSIFFTEWPLPWLPSILAQKSWFVLSERSLKNKDIFLQPLLPTKLGYLRI